MFKLASLQPVPNSYFNLETTEDLAAGGGIEGEERRSEKAKHLGVLLKKLNERKNVRWGNAPPPQARLQSPRSRITETPYFAPAALSSPEESVENSSWECMGSPESS